MEDSAALRELTKVILVRDGYNVLEAEDGVAAMEVSSKCHGDIHLVLTDVVMPRMRGPRAGGADREASARELRSYSCPVTPKRSFPNRMESAASPWWKSHTPPKPSCNRSGAPG